MMEEDFIFITGSAGTGKTQKILEFAEKWKQKGLNVVLTASTGIAASNINGITIHSFLESGISDNIEKYEKLIVNEKRNNSLIKKISNTNILIIDEVSLLSSSFIDMIDHILRKFSINSYSPFGGIKIIFSGDFLQLPPISKGNKKFAFQSKVWKNYKFKEILLTNIHRQKDDVFKSFLTKIRIGNNSMQVIKYFEDINYDIIENDKSIRLFTKNIDIDNYNERKLNFLKTKSYFYEAETSGLDKEIKLLTNQILANEILELKIGARIISLKNEAEFKYVNGSTGIILDLNDKEIFVLFDNGYKTVIKPNLWTLKNNNSKIIATFKQMPIKLAYAITIHKSQGMTIDNLIIECDDIFEEGQLYTALSRAKSKEGLKLIGFESRHIIVNQRALKYYEKLNKKTYKFKYFYHFKNKSIII